MFNKGDKRKWPGRAGVEEEECHFSNDEQPHHFLLVPQPCSGGGVGATQRNLPEFCGSTNQNTHWLLQWKSAAIRVDSSTHHGYFQKERIWCLKDGVLMVKARLPSFLFCPPWLCGHCAGSSFILSVSFHSQRSLRLSIIFLLCYKNNDQA